MRVIAGRYGGRTVRAPAGRATRPTAQRARQALFDILGNLQGKRVLDLYAGSGALGIEALSRGAAQAVFVEMSRLALEVLRDNLAKLDLEGSAVVLGLKVEHATRHLEPYTPFDLVFCDPPWTDLGPVHRNLKKLDWAGLMAEEALLILEHPARSPMALEGPKGFRVTDRRAWGDTGMTLYRWERPDDR